MSLADFFRTNKKSESVVLIDIGTKSVAGAYVHYEEGKIPVVLYTRRLPVEVRENEPKDRAMLRALQILSATLVREGAPVLLRTTGSGSAHEIFVSLDAPWQKTLVRTEIFEQEAPFVFTKNFVATILGKMGNTVPNMVLAAQSTIGTTLNGYTTRNPYGKRATQASISVLTSYIDEHIAKSVLSVLTNTYHHRRIVPIAGSSLRYQTIQKVFPHERDALIIDATNPFTSIALIRKGLLVSVIEMSESDPVDSWAHIVEKQLAEISKNYPLPRTVFLLARESDIPPLKEAFGTMNIDGLWFSDNPPSMVGVIASHITSLVRQATTTPPDLQLLLMALFRQAVAFDKKDSHPLTALDA
ncbi:MAG: hypothetical protein Q7T37_00785 [bacterium]|nr:hypothetical protein [bacterium]MDO8742431.1 hypothetical protein [bacterium]